MLVWQRDEQRAAVERWPDLFTADVIGNHGMVEAILREGALERPAARVELVIASVSGFDAHLVESGEDPNQEQSRLDYMNQAHERGEILAWPPARNQACWCGSGRKYKKCCGVPTPESSRR